MNKSTILRLLLITISAALTFGIFQNCGEVNLASNENSQSPCQDYDKNIFIQDSTRIIDTGWEVGESIQLQLWEESNGTISTFSPTDLNTEWPPRWFKNQVEQPPPIDKFISTTDDNTSACIGDLFTAKFMACGKEREVKKRYFTGPCVPLQCELNGVTAKVGEFGKFFRSPSVQCGESCPSLLRECILDPTSGDPVFSGDPSFSSPTCSGPELCPTTTSSSTTTSTSVPPGPPPIDIEPAGCTSSLNVIPSEWNRVFGGRPPGGALWPSFGVRRPLEVMPGNVLSFRFRTTGPNARDGSLGPNNIVTHGTFAFVDRPQSSGHFKLYISESEGCTDATMLHPRCSSESGSTAGGGVGWELPNAISGGFSCPLQHDKFYYINISCYADGASCDFDFQDQIQ